jgi:Subtilase family
VVDVSVNPSPSASAALSAAVTCAASRNVVLIAPVGENQNYQNQVSYPAAYPDVVAVGAVDSTGAPISGPTAGVGWTWRPRAGTCPASARWGVA